MKVVLFCALVALSAACTASTVDRATVNGGYGLELKDCILKGKAAKDIDVYTKCADDLDVRYGMGVAKDGGK